MEVIASFQSSNGMLYQIKQIFTLSCQSKVSILFIYHNQSQHVGSSINTQLTPTRTIDMRAAYGQEEQLENSYSLEMCTR